MTLSDDDETDDETILGDDESDDDDDGVTFYGSDDEVESQLGDDGEDEDDDDGVTFYGSDDEVESQFGDNGEDGDDDDGMAFYGSDDEVESQFDDDGDGEVTFYGSDDHVESQVEDDDDGMTFYGADDGGATSTTGGQAAAIESKATLKDCIKVGLADYAVADDHHCLSTSGLGSCIGVALHDRRADVYGLIHFMLPSADDIDDNAEEAKFADTGIEALVSEMEANGADPKHMEAKVAGGSTMVDFSDPEDGVGQRNIDAIRDVLDEFGIEITGSDLGGERGRTVRYDPVNAELEVQIAHEDTVTI